MEIQWIGVAFLLGMVAKALRQPPLIGFLAAGFVLELLGLRPDPSLKELADVGVLLMLFTIGIKLDIRELGRPHVFAVASLHTLVSTLLGAAVIALVAAFGFEPFQALSLQFRLILGFALSFSSTVFAMRILQDRNDLRAIYGRSAVGCLVMQDLVAVAFIASTGEAGPNYWALLVLLAWPLRPVLHWILDRTGHGELLTLGGFAAALAAALAFKMVGLKGDLGALVAGMLFAGHPRSRELASALYTFKDVFLVGFFLSIGLTGLPTIETLTMALFFLLILPFKGVLFVGLGLAFRMRARTAWLFGVSLTQLSEFGLLVLAALCSSGALPQTWLTAFAIALAVSFVIAAPFNDASYGLYRRARLFLGQFESATRIREEEPVDLRSAEVLIFGMGRIGEAAYDRFEAERGVQVAAFDIDPDIVRRQQTTRRVVALGSATDADLWDRILVDDKRLRWVVLAMDSHDDHLTALSQLRATGVAAKVAVTARHGDEVRRLREAGADLAVHVLSEAGAGFAGHVLEAEAEPQARISP